MEASEEAKEQYIVKTHLACLPFVKPVLEKLLQRVSKIASYGWNSRVRFDAFKAIRIR